MTKELDFPSERRAGRGGGDIRGRWRGEICLLLQGMIRIGLAGLFEATVWRKKRGIRKTSGGDLMSEELGVGGGWTDVGEEAFRGVAICCFCCPVVETVASYSQAPSFELGTELSVSV